MHFKADGNVCVLEQKGEKVSVYPLYPPVRVETMKEQREPLLRVNISHFPPPFEPHCEGWRGDSLQVYLWRRVGGAGHGEKVAWRFKEPPVRRRSPPRAGAADFMALDSPDSPREPRPVGEGAGPGPLCAGSARPRAAGDDGAPR